LRSNDDEQFDANFDARKCNRLQVLVCDELPDKRKQSTTNQGGQKCDRGAMLLAADQGYPFPDMPAMVSKIAIAAYPKVSGFSFLGQA
jgi:hypothetical protein